MLIDAGFPKQSNTVILGSAAVAGIVASAFSLPFDFVKTQLQKMQKLPDGTMPYKGFMDCFFKTLMQHGPFKVRLGLSPQA